VKYCAIPSGHTVPFQNRKECAVFSTNLAKITMMRARMKHEV